MATNLRKEIPKGNQTAILLWTTASGSVLRLARLSASYWPVHTHLSYLRHVTRRPDAVILPSFPGLVAEVDAFLQSACDLPQPLDAMEEDEFDVDALA